MPNKLVLKKFVLFSGDVFLLYLSLLITVFLGFLNEFSSEIFVLHFLPFSLIYFSWLIVFYIFGLYDLHLVKTKTSFYAQGVGAILVGLMLGMLFFYALPFFGITPKTNLVLNALIFGVLFFAWRNLFYRLFSVRFSTKISIIGKGLRVENLKNEISKRPYLGYELTQFNSQENFLNQIKKNNINTVVFTEEYESNPRLLKALYFCSPAKVNFLDIARAYELITEKIPLDTTSRSWFLENIRERERGLYDKIKRGLDVVLASLLLVLTLPFWILMAIFIKLEDMGPVFYSQERIGKNGKSFILYKFRSMRVGAEKGKAVWAKKEDKRITRIGKLLRTIHFDELPQMINVLKGDISLVGPRPERLEFVKELEKKIPHYHLRHIIKSGFTGWAQIKFRYGRSVMDSHEKFQYDLYYIKNRGLLLDIGILLKTLQLFFKHE